MPKGTIHTIPWEEGKQRDPTDDNSLSAPIIIIIIIPSQDYCNGGMSFMFVWSNHKKNPASLQYMFFSLHA
jgi:hypothetical protein